MKLPFRFCMAGILATCLFYACKSNSNNTAAADSANNKIIAATDSINKSGLSQADSAIKAQKDQKMDASKFLVKSYEAGLFEIQLSNLAATNALSPEVKDLASSLVIAHTGINAKMQVIAKASNFVLPETIDNDHQKALQEINTLKNADFDKKYIDIIVNGHEKSVANYKDAYQNLKPGQTKTFAAETLPLIEHHLAMATKVQKDIK